MAKLTEAQRAFLELIAQQPTPADPTYDPAMALADQGYATRQRVKGKRMKLWIFTITDAGRAALSDGAGDE